MVEVYSSLLYRMCSRSSHRLRATRVEKTSVPPEDPLLTFSSRGQVIDVMKAYSKPRAHERSSKALGMGYMLRPSKKPSVRDIEVCEVYGAVCVPFETTERLVGTTAM